MAVNVTTFSTTANQAWASSTWNVNDPSYKVNTELNNWIAALDDPTELVVVMDPGNATSRSSTLYVTWLIRCNKSNPSLDYGFLFAGRYAGTNLNTSSSYTGSYANRTLSSSTNNGYGSYTNYGPSAGNAQFTVAGTMIVAYKAAGALPWFMFAWENETRTDIVWNCLMKCDPSNQEAGSYYPSSGLEPWLYLFSGGGGSAGLMTAQDSYLAPYKGVNAYNEGLRAPSPAESPYGDGYFFRVEPQYGNSHYLGTVSDDFLLSNTSTGQFNDTMTLGSSEYRCMGNVAGGGNLWFRMD